MNLKKYEINYNSGDAVLVVEVDHDLMTGANLHLINNFWGDSKRRLEEEDDDVLHAVLTMLAEVVWARQMDYAQTVEGVIEDFNWDAKHGARGIEGWPKMDGSAGIRIVYIEDFGFSPFDIDIEEIKDA
jgi:hypothetical protein